MSLKSWIIKLIVERKGTPMLQNVMNKVSGCKTYIVCALAIVVLVAGRFWGPIDLPGPTDIPQVDSAAMWKGIWEAITVTFLRAGVKKSGPVTQ